MLTMNRSKIFSDTLAAQHLRYQDLNDNPILLESFECEIFCLEEFSNRSPMPNGNCTGNGSCTGTNGSCHGGN